MISAAFQTPQANQQFSEFDSLAVPLSGAGDFRGEPSPFGDDPWVNVTGGDAWVNVPTGGASSSTTDLQQNTRQSSVIASVRYDFTAQEAGEVSADFICRFATARAFCFPTANSQLLLVMV